MRFWPDRRWRRPYGIVTDPAGNVYVADHWNSRIQKFSETVAPRVANASPAAGASRVSPWANVFATFSEHLHALQEGLKDPLPAYVTLDFTDKNAVLDPSRRLQRGATYRVVITSGAKDLAGNPLAPQKAWSFKIR